MVQSIDDESAPRQPRRRLMMLNHGFTRFLGIVLCLSVCSLIGLLGPPAASQADPPAFPTLVQATTPTSIGATSASPAGEVVLDQGSLRKAGVPKKVYDVLSMLQERKGEPLPGYVGGRSFENRERRLPAGRYREYDVNPKVPGKNRGAERLVIEQRTGKAYYTKDHYRSFVLIN